ncbi:MAG: DUF547 domain-containing protein, partial [Gammaproteobacteria bacterium]|nr:DUF547 domain-containing protein [Gammaproteobacteria bacterium]
VALARVDYAAIKRDPLWSKTVAELAQFAPSQLSSKTERLAFYSNAYNILAIKMVLDHWPLQSIKDAGSLFTQVWNIDVGKIGGKTVTLNEVEHEIMRPMGDPRMHMAIVCASVSCPDLRSEPYVAERLDAQFDEQVVKFLNNSGKGLRQRDGDIEVSKIFGWFEEDFAVAGGVENFIRRYRNDLPRNADIEADIDYDWSLNGF